MTSTLKANYIQKNSLIKSQFKKNRGGAGTLCAR